MKKFFLTAIAAIAAMGVSAQEVVEQTMAVAEEETAGVGYDMKSNWFVSVGAGPQMFFGDHDRQRSFGQRISPALDVAVGKWITPAIGLRLMYSGLSAKGATQNGAYSTGEPLDNKPWHGYWLNKSKFDFMNLHVDVMLDLVNIIGGYRPDRVYNLAFYGGVGYGRVWNKPHNESITADLGFFNMFHVTKALDINLDLRLSGFQDDFDGEKGDAAFDGLVSVTAGLTYRFGPRGWVKPTRTVVMYDNEAVNELRAQVANLVARNEKLEKEKNAGQTVTHKVVEFVGGDYIVYFPINVTALSNADRAQLEMCSNAIKEAPADARFLIMGYADKSTGTPEVNEILSRTRAENVRACLVKDFGISPERLDVQWKGGVSNMFYDDPALSRVVIISPIKK